MTEMTKDKIGNFHLQGTSPDKLGTINKNGIPHAIPLRYTVDK